MSTVTPYLMVESAPPFVRFIENTFEAEVSHVVALPADPDRVIHAEARIGAGLLHFADSGPDGGQCQAFPTEPAHIQLWLTVDDAEETYARAIAAGATPVSDVTVQDDGSRAGGFAAFGTLWWVNTGPDFDPGEPVE